MNKSVGLSNMPLAIGTKVVKFLSMSRADYNTYRGWPFPVDENGADQGYLVEYVDGGTPNHANHDGYISWSPQEQFNKAYRVTTGLTFGLAVEAMKLGKKVARAGWNGVGMFVYYVPANKYPAQTGVAQAYFGEGAMVPYNAYMALKGTGDTVSVWTPSGSDALAEDWSIIECAK